MYSEKLLTCAVKYLFKLVPGVGVQSFAMCFPSIKQPSIGLRHKQAPAAVDFATFVYKATDTWRERKIIIFIRHQIQSNLFHNNLFHKQLLSHTIFLLASSYRKNKKVNKHSTRRICTKSNHVKNVSSLQNLFIDKRKELFNYKLLK